MPTKDTKVIAARVPLKLVQSMQAEAKRRGISLNEMVLFACNALYSVGEKGQETTPENQETAQPSDLMGWGTAK